MAREALPDVPFESAPDGDAAMQHGHWRNRVHLASGLRAIEGFLAWAGFAPAPWLVAGFGVEIGAWSVLTSAGWWAALMLACAAVLAAALLLREDGPYPYLRQVGALAEAAELTGTALSRQEQPAKVRVRPMLATRDPESGRAIKARVNVPTAFDKPDSGPTAKCGRVSG